MFRRHCKGSPCERSVLNFSEDLSDSSSCFDIVAEK